MAIDTNQFSLTDFLCYVCAGAAAVYAVSIVVTESYALPISPEELSLAGGVFGLLACYTIGFVLLAIREWVSSIDMLIPEVMRALRKRARTASNDESPEDPGKEVKPLSDRLVEIFDFAWMPSRRSDDEDLENHRLELDSALRRVGYFSVAETTSVSAADLAQTGVFQDEASLAYCYRMGVLSVFASQLAFVLFGFGFALIVKAAIELSSRSSAVQYTAQNGREIEWLLVSGAAFLVALILAGQRDRMCEVARDERVRNSLSHLERLNSFPPA